MWFKPVGHKYKRQISYNYDREKVLFERNIPVFISTVLFHYLFNRTSLYK